MPVRLAVALLALLATLPARADVVKWIDSKGQVNYSNTPPPSVAKVAQPVEERISVVGADPATRDAVARMEERVARRTQYEELDWQQRQRALAVQNSYTSYASPDYGMSYYPAYYSPYSYGGRVFNSVVPPRVVHHAVHMSHARPAARGFARR